MRFRFNSPLRKKKRFIACFTDISFFPQAFFFEHLWFSKKIYKIIVIIKKKNNITLLYFLVWKQSFFNSAEFVTLQDIQLQNHCHNNC